MVRSGRAVSAIMSQVVWICSRGMPQTRSTSSMV